VPIKIRDEGGGIRDEGSASLA